jgi:hypothetical protein
MVLTIAGGKGTGKPSGKFAELSSQSADSPN